MKRNIYKYLEIVNEAIAYFTKKYNLDYEEVSDICLQYLLVYLKIIDNNKTVKNHLKGLYLTKLNDYFRENRNMLNSKLKVKVKGLNELESLVIYLVRVKKYPLYQVSDLLNLDGYYIGNIIDNVDFNRKM